MPRKRGWMSGKIFRSAAQSAGWRSANRWMDRKRETLIAERILPSHAASSAGKNGAADH
jgi:hypothetical protein